jgi:probable rRNA maturation factor
VTRTVDIVVEAPGWRNVPDAESTARRAVEAAMTAADADGEIGVVLADDAAVRAANRRWRGKDSPTNVLSFPSPFAAPSGTRFLGDIMLALETVTREADSEGKPVGQHLAHLAVHGTLHLLGYDHENEAEAETMERFEIEILAQIGLPDPYAAQETRTEPA